MGEVDCRLHNQQGVVRGRHVADEEAVDFDFGERQLAKLHQRGEPGTEVVERKADALDAKASQRVHQLDQRLRRALRQFEHQAVGRHRQCAAHALNQVGEIEVLQRQGRNVERDMCIAALLAPLQPLAKRRPEAPLRQRVDQPMALCERDEA